MPVEIKVPSAGESVTEVVLARWLKKDGEYAKADEPVAELETDKATAEVAAPAAGTVRAAIAEGTTVPVGAVIGRIEEGAAPPSPPPQAMVAAAPARGPQVPTAKVPPPPAAPARVSPAARVMAEAKGIDLSTFTGSGRGGLITKQDLLGQPPPPPAEPKSGGNGAPAPAPTPTAPAQAGPRETRQKMSTIRARIAQRLIESQQTTASLTTFNEADLTAVNELRARYKESFEKKHGVKLGLSSFFVKAVVEGLKAFPVVNARIDGPDVVYQNFYDLSVAVSTEKGLMTPVLRDADKLTFAGVEKGILDLADRARKGKISVADLQGGTFTITNGGIFGSLLSTPILNPPQTAILGMHAIQRRPVAVGDKIEIRPMMYLALTYDHRLIDGREAVQFLLRVKECVENPERLMLGV
jgi:2-oxoglutarate dehydrogenase E2 component (dihydrolipoamide succinyltransferase)